MKPVTVAILTVLLALARQSHAQLTFDPSVFAADFGRPELERTEAFITQTGSANAATIDQRVVTGGTGHYAQIDQSGTSNRVTIDQSGSANRARIEQLGNLNIATLAQSGSANSLALTQTGNGNTFHMTQIGNSQIVADQFGDNNLIDAPLIGIGGTGTWSQQGNGNSITVDPNYAGPAIQSILQTGDGMIWTVQ